MAFTELLQNIFKTTIVAAILAGAVTALAQDDSTAPAALIGEVLSPQQVQEQLSENLINRAFGWSEMVLIPAKLTIRIGDIGTMYVRNRSSEARDFRILIEEPKDSAPDMRKYMRFGPRSFRLQPEETQVIKLIAKSPPDDVEEWRQRFSVQLLPFIKDRESSEEGQEELSFRLSGIYAVSLPVDVIH